MDEKKELVGWIIQIGDQYYSGYDGENGDYILSPDISCSEIVIDEKEPVAFAKNIRSDYFWDDDNDVSEQDIKIHKCRIELLN